MILALCVLPALLVTASDQPMAKPFTLEGKVNCDTCRAGYETPPTTPMAGAKVKVECKDRRNTQQVLYSIGGTTDSKGKYEIKVGEDHGSELCEVMLVSSPQRNCALVDSGRNCTRVMLFDPVRKQGDYFVQTFRQFDVVHDGRTSIWLQAAAPAPAIRA